jgi:zinc transporter, ZIP family
MMSTFLQIILLATLPALGNFLGGLLGEFISVPYKVLSLALHAATGILFAVIGVELLPQALTVKPAWVIILAFFLGGVVFLLIEASIEQLQLRSGNAPGAETNSAWGIYTASAIDLFSDGLMIGTSATISLSLGLLLALGQVSADLPTGFATIASFKREHLPRSQRLLLNVSFLLPVLIGAAIGYFLVSGQSQLVKYSLLSLTAGILLTTVAEEVIPQAHQEEDARLAALFLVGGFALFTPISVYLE